MAHTSRNFIFAYALLVILPLVGLAGVLRTGRSLVPPPSIDGVWTLQLDSAPLSALACGNILAAIPDKAIVISQSGRTLILNAAAGSKLSGAGTLEGNALRGVIASPPDSPVQANCPASRSLSLNATVEQAGDFRSLTGTLSVMDCAACPAVGFRAERQKPAAPKGGN